MEGRVGVRLMAAAVMVMTMMMFRPSSAVLIKAKWAPGSVNLTQWASNQTFYVGVWIGFWYEANKKQYNVLEVNKLSYQKCFDQGFLTNITRGGGRDVFQLNQARTYYFISSGGYCWSGLKMAVNVQPVPPPPAAIPAPKSGSPPSHVHGVQILLPILFCIIAAISRLY